jgi:hypothetical protein
MAAEQQYVALVAIDHGNARAYNPGDPVPAANVKLHGYGKDQVAKVGTKAADEATPDPADAQITDTPATA